MLRLSRCLQSALTLSLILAFALALPLCAQTVTGAINGTVTDSTGAVISGATVTAIDVERHDKFSATTDSSGLFTITRLPVSRYEVIVEKGGFEKAKYPAFTLVLNQVAQVNVQLKAGSAGTEVVVEGTTPLLETGTSEVSSVVDARATASIPLATRNYGQLTMLTPGAVNPNPQSFTGPQATFQTGRPYINGNREQQNYYALDGMENTEHDNNDVAYSPSVDAIQEFNLIAQNAPADFGNYAGGIVSVSLKSGTNQYHGDVFEFIRNDVFNANQWSNNLLGDNASGDEIAPRPVLRWNEFGGTIGGPIIKDKLFFFADYQGSRYSQPQTIETQNVLTANERAGNFSSFCASGFTAGICNTASEQLYTAAAGTAPGARTHVLNNTYTSLDPAAHAIVTSQYYPLPTSGNLLSYTQQSHNYGDQGDVKLDYIPDQNDHVYFRYSQMHQSNPTINSFDLAPSGNNDNEFPLQNGVIDWTRTISATLVNDARAGLSHFPISEGYSNAAGVNLPTTFGIAGSPSPFMPAINPGVAGLGTGGFGLGTGGFGNNLSGAAGWADTELQASDTLTWTKGKHEIHAGFQWSHYRDFFLYPGNEGLAGEFNFGGTYSGNGTTAPGLGEADFMEGLPNGVAIGAAAGDRHVVNSIYAIFAQDNWRLTPRLTVNAGLRWEYSGARDFIDNDATNWTLFGGTPSLAGQNGANQSLYSAYNGIANFQPRLGLAWQPEFVKNTVVRAAFGISNFNETNGTNNLASQNPPWQTSHTVSYNVTDPDYPGTTLDQGFTGFPSAACNSAGVLSFSAACYGGVTIHVTQSNIRPEVSQQWNLSIQHQFGNSTTFQVAYVGEHSYELSNIVLLEQKELGAGGVVTASPFLNTAILSQVGAARDNISNGVADYNALQVVLQQRLFKGLQAQVNYTFSKCLTDSPGYFGQFGDAYGASQTDAGWAFPQNTYNQLGDYGLCNYNSPQLLNGYVLYDLPFGRGRQFGNNMNKVVDGIVGGWGLDSDFTLHSGFALSLANPEDSSKTGSGNSRPNCISGVPQHLAFQPVSAAVEAVLGAPAYQFLNPAEAVPDTTANTFGDCPVGSEVGPDLKTMDLGLAKHFLVTERVNVEFRAEAINLTNTPAFVAPSEWGGLVAAAPGIPSAYGTVTGSLGARQLQFGLKIHF